MVKDVTKIFSIPGLSFNPNIKNPKKIVQNLLLKDLSETTDIVISHGVLNNSLSKHESNNFRPLTVSQLLDILNSFENKLRAPVYCQRFRTPNILLNLNKIEKSTNIKVFSIVDDFISTRKQKDPDLFKKLKALQQSPTSELKHAAFLLRKECKLDTITDKAAPSGPVRAPERLSSVQLPSLPLHLPFLYCSYDVRTSLSG